MARWKLALLALAAFPAAADAQFYMTGPLSPGVAPSFLGYDAISIVLKEKQQQQEINGDAASDPSSSVDEDTSAGSAGTSEARSVKMSFTPSRARRAANLASFVDKSRRISPEGAAELQRLLQSGDIIGEIDRGMREQYGMSANDVADAFAVWWTTSWMGSKGRTDSPTREQMAMVRGQAASAFAKEPEFRAASDAEKQQYAEALLIQAAMNDAMVGAAQNDPAMLQKVKAAIVTGAKNSGVDLASMTLTDDGFVPAAGKISALDAAAGDTGATGAGTGDKVLWGAALVGLGAGGVWMAKGRRGQS